MGNVGPLIVSVIAGVIGLAMVAVLVSQKANTQGVVSSAGGALASVINAAVSPVSGSSANQFGSSSGGFSFATPFGSISG